MNRGHYAAFAIIVAGGLATSFLLVPRDEELALIHLRDKDFESARKAYEANLAAGGVNPRIVAPLVQLYLQHGEVDRAIGLMKRYLELYPNDEEAMERLAVYLQYDQRSEEYLQLLERLSALKPKPERLRELSDGYNFTHQYDKQIQTLERLTRLTPSAPGDFIDLAQMLATQGRLAEGATALRRMRLAFPNAMDADSADLFVNLLLDSGQTNEALRNAVVFASREGTIDLAAEWSTRFLFKGHPRFALALLEPFERWTERMPNLLRQYAQLEVANGRSRGALMRLVRLYERGRLPEIAAEPLVDLALQLRRTDLAIQVAAQAALPVWLRNGVTFAKLALAADLLRQNRADSRAWSLISDVIADSAAPAASLTDAYHLSSDNGDPLRALQAALRLIATDDNAGHHAWAGLSLIALNQPAAAVKHLKLAIGDSLDSRPDLVPAFLEALNQARAAGEPVEAELSRVWKHRLDSAAPDSVAYEEAAYALVDLKSWQSVLAALKRLETRKAGGWAFVLADAFIALNRPQELVEFLDDELRSIPFSAEDEEVRVQLMLEHGPPVLALPHVRRVAERRGGAWARSFEEIVRQLDRTDLLAGFWSQQLERPGAPPEEVRLIGYSAIDAGRIDLALLAFEKLARTAAPSSPDVSELVYLASIEPGSFPLVEWVQKRAETADPDERVQWVEILNTGGAFAQASGLAAGDLRILSAGRGFEAGLTALAGSRDRQMGSAFLASPAVQSDPEKLRRLGRVLGDLGLGSLAENAYRRALELNANDREALARLGSMAFTASDFDRASPLLTRAVELDSPDPETWFHLAEIRKRSGVDARSLYETALARNRGESAVAKLLRAQTLDRLGRTPEAIADITEVLRDHVDDGHVRADLAALLMSHARYAEARAVLSEAHSVRDDAAAQRLDILRAQLPLNQGDLRSALQQFGALYRHHPESAPVLTGLAEAELSSGRRIQARRLYDAAFALRPQDRDIADRRRDILREFQPQIAVTVDRRTFAGNRREQTSAAAAWPLNLNWSLAATLDRARLSNPNREARTVNRGSFQLNHESNGGLRTVVALAGSAGGAGLSIERSMAGPSGRTAVQGTWRQPFWEFLETVDGDVRRNRLELSREQRLNARTSARLIASANRYSASTT